MIPWPMCWRRYIPKSSGMNPSSAVRAVWNSGIHARTGLHWWNSSNGNWEFNKYKSPLLQSISNLSHPPPHTTRSQKIGIQWRGLNSLWQRHCHCESIILPWKKLFGICILNILGIPSSSENDFGKNWKIPHNFFAVRKRNLEYSR